MKMKTRIASLVILLGTSAPLLSATELERLRALCAEQEMQIQHLEEKVARLTESPPPPRKTTTSANPTQNDSASTYTVKAGDNIERIARNQNTTAAILYQLNNLKPSSLIHPGQKIKLPATSSTPVYEQPTHINNPSPASAKHTVKDGETYYRISKQYGISVDQLIAANPNINHNALRVGQSINIPTAKNLTESPDPKPSPSLSQSRSQPVLNSPSPTIPPTRAIDRLVKITKEITYLNFAKSHNTTTQRLDELNALKLDPTTVLAQGSELYVPAQP